VLPSWVAHSAAPKPTRAKRPARFIERTLQQTARFVEHSVFAERSARRPGLLQSLDARVKVFSLLAVLVGATFLHHAPSVWLIGAFTAVAALLSRVELRALCNRVWWFAPGVFVLVAIPAVFSVIVPGDALLTIYSTDAPPRLGPLALPPELAVTRQGVASAALVVSRLIVGVLLAVTLVLTTPWQELLRAAYTSTTAPFVLVLAMTHRYLFVLLRLVENMHLARRARTIAPVAAGEAHRWIGSRVGALFSRSRRLTEQVYAAMLARGYDGTPRSLTSFRFGRSEALWAVACCTVLVVALVGDRTVLGGLPW
jgi:cobalt/nickel transport system permease protein